MSNRRNLIGEVSLPKISEKVWNRVQLTFEPGAYVGTDVKSKCDYAPISDILINILYDEFEVFFSHNAGKIEHSKSFSKQIDSPHIGSWTPLEDDSYKYIVFPMYLEVGDNGDKGKMLYEYLTVKYPDGGSYDLSEEIYVDGDIMPYIDSGYRLTAGQDWYKLHANGSITHESHTGGGLD